MLTGSRLWPEAMTLHLGGGVSRAHVLLGSGCRRLLRPARIFSAGGRRDARELLLVRWTTILAAARALSAGFVDRAALGVHAGRRSTRSPPRHICSRDGWCSGVTSGQGSRRRSGARSSGGTVLSLLLPAIRSSILHGGAQPRDRGPARMTTAASTRWAERHHDAWAERAPRKPPGAPQIVVSLPAARSSSRSAAIDEEGATVEHRKREGGAPPRAGPVISATGEPMKAPRRCRRREIEHCISARRRKMRVSERAEACRGRSPLRSVLTRGAIGRWETGSLVVVGEERESAEVGGVQRKRREKSSAASISTLPSRRHRDGWSAPAPADHVGCGCAQIVGVGET